MDLDKAYAQEATLTRHVKKYLDKQPDVSYYKASDRYQKGISDIIACVGGIFVAMELKAEDEEATPHQKLFIKEIVRAGGVGGECKTMREVINLLEGVRSKRRR